MALSNLPIFFFCFDLYRAMKRLAIKQHAKCKQKTKKKTEFCRNILKSDIVFCVNRFSLIAEEIRTQQCKWHLIVLQLMLPWNNHMRYTILLTTMDSIPCIPFLWIYFFIDIFFSH